VATSGRDVYLLQRKASAIGKGLAPTTGWAHKISLQRRGVHFMPGVNYRHIDDAGVHLDINGQPQLLVVDTVIVCAGQDSERSLYDQLHPRRPGVHLIGGADLAQEIDAKRAIDQGCRLAAEL
jgi:2,4-dienoyl-CoA reductase (NADPH2)